jgi:hypothetical protein
MEEEVDWVALRDQFPDPVTLLDEKHSQIPRRRFLEILESLHWLLDKETDEYTDAFCALALAARNSRFRASAEQAALISECGFALEYNHRWQISFPDVVQNVILAATRIREDETVELLPIGNIVQPSK